MERRSIPERRLSLFGELNVRLRRRRAEWRSTIFAASIAGAWLGFGFFLLARLG